MSISSYPTTVMYNSSKPHTTSGYKNKGEILQFIEDVLNPPVIQLDYEQWIMKINNKKADEVQFSYFRNHFDPSLSGVEQIHKFR